MARKLTSLAGLRSLRGYSQSHSLADEMDFASGGKKGMAEKKLKEARELSDRATASGNKYDHYEANVKLSDARALLIDARHPEYEQLSKEIKERMGVHQKANNQAKEQQERLDGGKASGLMPTAAQSSRAFDTGERAKAVSRDSKAMSVDKAAAHGRAANEHQEAAHAARQAGDEDGAIDHLEQMRYHRGEESHHGKKAMEEKDAGDKASKLKAFADKGAGAAGGNGFQPIERVTDTKQADYEAAKAKAEGHSAKGEHKEAHAAHNAAANVARSLGDSAAAQMHQDKADSHLMASAASAPKPVAAAAAGGHTAGVSADLVKQSKALMAESKRTLGSKDYGRESMHDKLFAKHEDFADNLRALGHDKLADAHQRIAGVHESSADSSGLGTVTRILDKVHPEGAAAAPSGKAEQLKAFAEKVAPTATAAVVNVASGGGKAPEGGHKELSAAARSLSKGIKTTGEGDHGAAAQAHAAAAAAHRAKSDEHKAAGNKLAANAHIASATVHERAAAEHQLQVGAKGGTYYISDSGQKVYTKK